MTTAEKIAARLGNDGKTWETEEGIHLVNLARSQGARTIQGGDYQ